MRFLQIIKNITKKYMEDTSMTVQKMVFVYNAILRGWTVRMIDKDKFEFTKDTNSEIREVNLADYLKKFIQYNLNIDNLNI